MPTTGNPGEWSYGKTRLGNNTLPIKSAGTCERITFKMAAPIWTDAKWQSPYSPIQDGDPHMGKTKMAASIRVEPRWQSSYAINTRFDVMIWTLCGCYGEVNPLYRSSLSQRFHSHTDLHRVKTSSWPKPSLHSWSLTLFIWSLWFQRWQEPSASAARWITRRSFTMMYVSWWRKRSSSDTVCGMPWICLMKRCCVSSAATFYFQSPSTTPTFLSPPGPVSFGRTRSGVMPSSRLSLTWSKSSPILKPQGPF